MNRSLSVVLPILVPDAFCRAMTEFCISALRSEADNAFELVVVETCSRHFENHPKIDKYLHRPELTTYVKDYNAGADAATGDLLVHFGNDLFVGQHWDSALKEPFDKYADCGLSTTTVMEAGAIPIGHPEPLNVIVEGHMTALMCMSREWRLDPVYCAGYSDSDLIMRIYTSGKRSYRNYRSIAYHLRNITWSRSFKEGQDHRGQMSNGEEIFYARWKESPLWIYSMLRGGGVQWAQEHRARLAITPSQMRAQQ